MCTSPHLTSERKRKVILTKIASLSFLWIPCESYFTFQTYLQHQPFSDCTKSYQILLFKISSRLIIEILTRWHGRNNPQVPSVCATGGFFKYLIDWGTKMHICIPGAKCKNVAQHLDAKVQGHLTIPPCVSGSVKLGGHLILQNVKQSKHNFIIENFTS